MTVLARYFIFLVVGALILGACADAERQSGAKESSATPSESAESSSPTAVSSEESEVISAFETYRQALIDVDGAETARLMAEPTVQFYEDMTEVALTATKAELLERRIMDGLVALFLRQLVDPGRLEDMTGEEVIELAVTKGLINDSSVVNVKPLRAEVQGDTARLIVAIDGGPAPPFIVRREDDGWKIDLAEFFDFAEVAFRDQMEDAGLEKDAYLLVAVEATADEKPSQNIWDPPRP